MNVETERKHSKMKNALTDNTILSPRLRRRGVRRPQHLPNDPHALPVLRRAPVHARVLTHVQVPILVLLVDALLVARGNHPDVFIFGEGQSGDETREDGLGFGRCIGRDDVSCDAKLLKIAPHSTPNPILTC